MERRLVPIRRDCPARLVPIGEPIVIPKNTFVTLTQSLGGTYTVVFNGKMARIDGVDADALGFEPERPNYVANADGSINADDVHGALKTIFDPEIPVNIVDLGLIYDIAIKPERVDVKMTLTALGCPMAGEVMTDVRDHLLTLPGVKDAGVDIVYEPVWTPERMSEDARWELGMV
jgi:probable FeS assembly SUF system protein SufT